jgi:hypothetical protein
VKGEGSRWGVIGHSNGAFVDRKGAGILGLADGNAYAGWFMGDVNVDGNLQTAGFVLPTGAVEGYVLTSDAEGVGTWGPAGTGSLPPGTAGQTLRHDGTSWLANSLLYNDGSRIGIGTTNLEGKLKVVASSGTAIHAEGQSLGIFGYSSSTTGDGVKGFAGNTPSAASGRGGWFCSWGNSGKGVEGLAASGSGTVNYGGYFVARGSAGRGVYGQAEQGGYGGYFLASAGKGVYGEVSAASGTNYGGYFLADGAPGTGVYGETTSMSGYGVYGKASGSAIYAGYFDGLLHATSVSSTVKAFRIDHPLDPANRFLSHSSVESPDMMNIYNGNVTLGPGGEAWVELPRWFEALNRDFRYQLTPVGSPGPGLFIADEISINRFRVAGGEPGMKVSWQVTGIRQDPAAQQHRIVVEMDKPAHERGKYLNPEAYGVPKSMGIGHQPPLTRDQEAESGVH